jgi:very-short-patch-repair endonuclease
VWRVVHTGGWVVNRGTEVDWAIARIAGANNRVIPWFALRDAGVTHRAVEHRVAIGRLYRHHTGVYLLDPPEQAGRLTLLTAAVAACGPEAILSHASAAELWGLLEARAGDIDVTVIGRNPGVRAGVRRHRSTTLTPRDIRTKRAIRVTSPARTVMDCAPDRDLEELLANALTTNLVTKRQLDQTIAEHPAQPGVPRLHRILNQPGGPRRTRSWGERRLLALVRQAGLPVPMTNRLLNGYQVDAVWPDQRLVVEIDGYEFHGGRRAFATDRKRDAAHVAAGYRVIRFTADQLQYEPLIVIGQLSAALALALAS